MGGITGHRWSTVGNSKFLVSHYPDLQFADERLVKGSVKFSATIDDGVIILNPTQADELHIEDEYQIEIRLPVEIGKNIPELYLTGSRIPEFARAKGIKLIDLHFFANHKACLCPLPVQWEAILDGKAGDLAFFLDELVVPFLYQQSYFQKFGKWPIKNFSHGYFAFFEYYKRSVSENPHSTKAFLLCKHALEQYSSDFPELNTILSCPKSVSAHRKCFCGSNSKLKKCHKRKMAKEAYEGVLLFVEQLIRI